MKNILFLVLGISQLFLTFAFGGEKEAPEEQTLMAHHIGAAGGFVTGYGLSYRHWSNNGYGYQLTIAPYLDKSTALLSLGITGLKNIHIAPFANLFAYYGVHYNYSKDTYNDIYDSSSKEESLIFIGGGPGFELHFGNISLDIMFGLAARYSTQDKFGLQMTIDSGLYYSFNPIKLIH